MLGFYDAAVSCKLVYATLRLMGICAQEHFYNLCMTESSRRDSEHDQTRVSQQTW